MDVQIGPRTEMTEDRSDQGPKWMPRMMIMMTGNYVILPAHSRPLDTSDKTPTWVRTATRKAGGLTRMPSLTTKNVIDL